MIYFHWLFLAFYILTIVPAMVTVLMDRRQPAKTIAWLMVLLFLPLVGIILYFFFGQNTRKERLVSQRSLDQLTKHSMLEFAGQRNLKIPEDCAALVRQFANQSMALPFKDNNVDIYTDGYQFFLNLMRDLGTAQHHIHLESYIFEDDPLSNLLADVMIDKARAGVEVRVIYDDVGSWKVRKRFFDRMRAGGVKVCSFMPVKFPAFTGKVNYRNHRKICIVDGKVGYIGGMNIALRYLRGSKHQPWRDTHMRLEGGLVYALQRSFLIDWYFVERSLITSRIYYPELDPTINNDCLGQIVTSSPIQPWPDIMQGYVRILLEAKRYVYIETPYFLPTEPILFAMRTAAVAGIDVRLMIPMHSDAKLVEWASKSYVMEVIEAGVKVFFYNKGFNHSKLLVSDDFICSCGSTNVDFRSFENNFEANAFFYHQEMALKIKQIFLDDQADSLSIEEVRNLLHTPFLQRLWESIIRLLSPLL